MSVGPRFRLRALATSAMALGVLGGATPIAAAHEGPGEDPRAVVVDGNVDEGMKLACEKAGLDGEPVDKAAVTVESSAQAVTITELPASVEITGVVVKGGSRYNLYQPGENGMALEPVWKNLRSPLNNGGNLPTVSHWFLCGASGSPATTTPPVQTTPPESTQPPATTTSPGTSRPPGSTTTGSETTSTTDSRGPSSTSGSPGASTTTSQEAVAPANDTDDLASTGFGAGWMVGLGALLLAGGGALLVLARKRRTTS